MKICNLVLVLGIAPMVMACGGGGGGTASPQLIQDSLNIANETQDILDRIDPLPNTVGANVPTSGSATYSGTLGGVAMLPSGIGDPATFLGNADVTANFATNTMSGSARDFIGTTGGLNSQLTRYSGTVAITSGDFGGANRSDVTANASGSLTSTGGTFSFDGPIEGDFVGANAEGLRMTSGTTGFVRLDSTNVVGGLELVTER